MLNIFAIHLSSSYIKGDFVQFNRERVKAPVNILNNDFCANPDPWEEGNFKNLYYRKMYSHNMVCAGHEKGFMDACQDQIKN